MSSGQDHPQKTGFISKITHKITDKFTHHKSSTPDTAPTSSTDPVNTSSYTAPTSSTDPVNTSSDTAPTFFTDPVHTSSYSGVAATPQEAAVQPSTGAQFQVVVDSANPAGSIQPIGDHARGALHPVGGGLSTGGLPAGGSPGDYGAMQGSIKPIDNQMTGVLRPVASDTTTGGSPAQYGATPGPINPSINPIDNQVTGVLRPVPSDTTTGGSPAQDSATPGVMPSDSDEQELLRRKRMIDSGTVPKDEAWAAGGAGVGEIVSHEGGAAFDLGNPRTFDTGSVEPTGGSNTGTYVGAAQDTLNAAKDYAAQTYDVVGNKAAETYNAAADRLGTGRGSGTTGEAPSSNVTDTPSDVPNQAADTANTTYGTARDTAAQTYNTVADTAGQAYGTARDTAAQTYNVAADKTGQAYNVAADTAAQTYNVAADKAGQAYNVTADTAAQTYNVAADKAGQAYAGAKDYANQTAQATYDTVKPHYDYAVQATQDTAAAAADKASQTLADAKDYTAQTAQRAQEKAPEVIQTTKETAAAAAAATAAGAAGAIQGVQEVAGVTPHNPGETPQDEAGQEVKKDETAETARSTTVSLLSSAGGVLAAGAAMAGGVLASGAQYAKATVLGAPNTAGYNTKDGAGVVPSDADEKELVRRKQMIESGTVPKDEAAVAGGAGLGEIISHEGGAAFGAPPASSNQGRQGTTDAVQITGDAATELQRRKDMIASGAVPTDEAGVAAGAGVDEVLSHGDRLGSDQSVPVSGGGSGGATGGTESLFTKDLTAQQNVPSRDEGLVPGGPNAAQGDPLLSVATSAGATPAVEVEQPVASTGGITGLVSSFFGSSKPAE